MSTVVNPDLLDEALTQITENPGDHATLLLAIAERSRRVAP